jgi:hypothetical protein
MLLCGSVYAEDDITFVFTDTGTTTIIDYGDIELSFGEVEALVVD